MATIHQKLQKIQQQCHIPKGNFNSFGNYSYRSCEDILEALKPHLAQQDVTLTLSDEIINISNRFYVKTTALLVDSETGESISTTALAREPEAQKNFLEPQITGSASSYARKYCISGLFCLDGNRDIDNADGIKANADNFEDTSTPFDEIINNHDCAKCEVCETLIVNPKVVKYSTEHFGRKLCYNCQQELKDSTV